MITKPKIGVRDRYKVPHILADLRRVASNFIQQEKSVVYPNLHIEIEATNRCNTQCLHCPRNALTRSSGTMDLQTYSTIINKVIASSNAFCVVYAGVGEPLLNPSTYDFIKYIDQRGRTSVITNGSALTPQIVQRLIDAGVDQITMSFNGAEKELYELMTGGLSFERARANLEKAVQMTTGTRTVMGANVSVTRQTRDHLVSIRNYLEEIGIKTVYFSMSHNRGGFLKGDSVSDTPLPPSDQTRCDMFKNILFVSWTGKVLSCYHDLAGANEIGDLKVESIDTILERKTQILAEGVKFDICSGCNDMYRFCDDRLSGGKSLSDCIYELYAQGDSHVPVDASSLSEWLGVLNDQVNQSQVMMSSKM